MKRFDPHEFEVTKGASVGASELIRDNSVIDWLDDFSKKTPRVGPCGIIGPLDVDFDCDEIDEYLGAKGFFPDYKVAISDRKMTICNAVVSGFLSSDQCEHDEMLSIGMIALCERGHQVLTEDLKKKTVRAAIKDFRVEQSSLLSFPVNRRTVRVIARGKLSVDDPLDVDNQRALLRTQVDMVPPDWGADRASQQSADDSLGPLLEVIRQEVGNDNYDLLLRYYGGGKDERNQLASELGIKNDSLAKKTSRMTTKLSGVVRYLSHT